MIMIDACYHRTTPRPPVWLMRQAGRYLPEYMAIRSKSSFLEMCHNPELVKEVTLQPIRRFNMDAAIIFSDILIPFEPMGLDLSFQKGEGPVIGNPIKTMADVDKLRMPDFDKDLDFVGEALALTRAELDPSKALIGFAGAPFTLACYAIQGHGGKNFETVRQFMYREPQVFEALLSKFADMTIDHLRFQIKAGANVVQLFDSWGGLLSSYDYFRHVFHHVQRVLNGLNDLDNVPRILFVKGASHFRNFLKMANCEVVGLDWTMSFEESRKILGDEYAVQGNLDPMYLFADPERVRRRVRALLELNHDHPGYIFNLGHGINKETPVENVKVLVDTVLNYRRENHS